MAIRSDRAPEHQLLGWGNGRLLRLHFAERLFRGDKTPRASVPRRNTPGAIWVKACRLTGHALLLLAFFSLLTPSPVEADALPLHTAINKAGRQRMLTQRIVKTYCLVGLGVAPHESRAQLAEATAMFKSQLAELNRGATDLKVKQALADVERLWPEFEAITLEPVSREGARLLAARDDTLLEAADRVVLALQELSDLPYARLVNISGRQRMLSQRVAKFYVLRAWGLASVAGLEMLERARNEFEGALSELQSATENTSNIHHQLAAARDQWRWLDSALRFNDANTYFPEIVNDAAEKTLNIMERVTESYEELFFLRTGG